MKPEKSVPTSIAEYIAPFPSEVRFALEKVWAAISKAAPGAEERIAYKIPTFVLNGSTLAHFGAFKTHIGLYPPVRDKQLKRETSRYAGEKGNLRFPLDEPIPLALISRIVKARMKENREGRGAERKRLRP